MRLSARRGKPSGCGAFDTGRRGTRAACSAWSKLRTEPPFDPFIGTSVFRSPRSPNCSAIRLGGPPSIGSTPESRLWRGSEAGAPQSGREEEAFLEAQPGEVAFVTITIGANDVIGTEADCLDDATITFDLVCIQAQLPSIQANLAEIVERLQAAAPGVPIVGSTYYNALLGAWVLVPGPVGQFLASASVAPVELLNTGIAAA